MATRRNVATVVIVFFIVGFFYLYKLTSSFNFHPDYARDISDTLSIVQGKPTLIGPKLSFGGYYSGPYYYYLLAPALLFSHSEALSPLYVNTFLFLIALLYFAWESYKKFGPHSSLLAVIVIAFVPLYITSARGPWNGSMYLSIFLAFLTFIYFKNPQKKLSIFIAGLVSGIIVTIHFVTVTVIIPCLIILFLKLKKKSLFLFALTGFVLAFFPLLLFELKHDFIMFRNTFLNRSYLSFLNGASLPNTIVGKKNVIENIFFLNSQTGSLIVLPPLLFIVIGIIFIRLNKNFEKKWIIAAVLSYCVIALLLRYQFGIHYVYPVIFFIFIVCIFVILEKRWILPLIILLLTEYAVFPKGIYKLASRNVQKYDAIVEKIIDQHIIKKNDQFDIIQYSKDYGLFVPVGDEYRYFFKKNGYVPLNQFQYQEAKTLLIITEVPKLNIDRLNTWETQQFGLENLKNRQTFSFDGIIVYKIMRTKP